MIDITAELLNEIPWFDGIIYIILGLLISFLATIIIISLYFYKKGK